MIDFAAFSIPINTNGLSQQRVRCTQCGRGPRDRTLGVNLESGIYHCFRCSWSGRVSSAKLAKATPVALYSAEKRSTLSDQARQLWGRCQPISGTAQSYLQARHCRIRRKTVI